MKVQRIHVMGVSGSGKTTVAGRIAARLGVPQVELDAIHWQPNWTMLATAEFRVRVAEALEGDAWVVDGNYNKVRDLVWERAQQVIFLDLPLGLTIARLLNRTIRRSLRRERLWAGNRESLWTAFLSRDSVIYYALRSRRRRQKEFESAQNDPGYRHMHFKRLSSPAEIEAFIESL
jgi:adenylate kinase family enzyme